MGQVAFDTQEFVETLENAGLPKDQARAISIAVRKSHEVADVATKADIIEVNRNITDVRKDLSAEIDTRFSKVDAQFEKTDAKIAEVKRDVAEVRKDLAFEIADARKEIASQIDFLRKDVESTSTWLLIKMGSLMLAIVCSAAAFLKFF